MPNIHDTLKELNANKETKKKKIKAGGPGSGRHKEFGKFEKQNTFGGGVLWKSPKGVKVIRQGSGKYFDVTERQPGSDSGKYTGPTSGKREDVDKHLQEHYGIDTEDKSRGVQKQTRRTSEQKRRDSYVHYD